MKLNDLLKTSGNDSDLIFNDKHRAIKNYRLMQWAKWATFGLYIVAVFMLYVADVWGIGSFIEQKSNDWVALIVFSAIAFVLAFFLASSKEAVYEDIALHRAEGYKLKTSQIVAMGLFLTSGLLFEMFSTSNNQQHIANSAAEGSSMMKEVTGSNVTLSAGSTALTQDLQAAQMRLADCKVRMEKALAKGKTYDCAQSEANVAAVRESMQMANAMANDTNAAALNAKTDAMLKVREHFDKPMFKEIGKVAGTDNNGGMLIVIGVLIFIFECQHIMALFAYANALRRIKSKGGNVAQDQPRSTQDAYNITPPLSAFDSAKMSVAEYAQKVEDGLKASPEVIATEYARAQHAREQMAAKTGDTLQAVGNKIESAFNPHVGFLKLLIAENQARVNHGMDTTHENVKAVIADVLKRHQKTTGQDTSNADVNKLTDLVMKHLKPSKPEVAERHHLYCTLANGRQMDRAFKAHEADAALKEWQRLNDTGIGEDGNPIARLGLHQTYFETEKDAEAFEKKIEAENLKWQSDEPAIKSVTGFKQSPEQLATVRRLYQEQMQEYEAGKVFNESPTPPIEQLSIAETIRALVDAVKKSGAKTEADIQVAVFNGYQKLFNPADLDDGDLLKVAAKIAKSSAPATPAPAVPFGQKVGGTGLQNPALGTAEEHYALPIPETMPAQSGAMPPPSTMPAQSGIEAQTGDKAQSETMPAQSQQTGIEAQPETMPAQSEVVELTAAAKQIETDLYPEWLELVGAGAITPAAQHCKQFISKRTKNKDAAIGITAPEMGRIWLNWQDRAANDGVLVANPKYQPGNRQAKYLLVA